MDREFDEFECSPKEKIVGFSVSVTRNNEIFSGPPLFPVNITGAGGVFPGSSPGLQSHVQGLYYDPSHDDGSLPVVLAIGGRWVGVHNGVDCTNSASVSYNYLEFLVG